MSGVEPSDFRTVGEFEVLFWQESEHIRAKDPKALEYGPHYVTQHPSRTTKGPGEKHTNEWLPLLILAKQVAGQHANWDKTLTLSVSHGDDRKTHDGKSYDASYKFVDNNFQSKQPLRYIEVTRGNSPKASASLKEEDKILSSRGTTTLPVTDGLAGIEEMKADILLAVGNKSRKFGSGQYQAETTLLVWLRSEYNHAWGRHALDHEDFRKSVLNCAAEAFSGICIVGLTCGVVWMKGVSL